MSDIQVESACLTRDLEVWGECGGALKAVRATSPHRSVSDMVYDNLFNDKSVDSQAVAINIASVQQFSL